MHRIGTIKWAYGVTTVPERVKSHLPRTLASLAAGGFDKPRLFVDGCSSMLLMEYANNFRLEVTPRIGERIRTAGNWVLSMYELYYREPTADRFVIFQDDMVTCKNLRSYLERAPYPDTSYLNLYTFPSNQSICPKDETGRDKVGWFKSNQYGRGAVALVFSREALVVLLSSPHLAARPQDCTRGHKAIDGGILESMKKAGWIEYVHNPSLVQHTGEVSTTGNRPHKLAESFPGEEADALDLLRS